MFKMFPKLNKYNRRHLQLIRNYSSRAKVQSDRNELSSEKIRKTFVDFFVAKNNHKFIRSSPVIPFCDPTVPFVNAGMNQFKNIFLNESTPPSKTAANSQKCIRVGGKHNDLDIVGTDGYHHTFFEMLGNWSFGDYFKEKACKLAYELLTGPYNIDPSRLYVTYFSGNEELGLRPDLECREIWRSIGIENDRILPFGSKENFWEMGLTGPCGPCTEIHIDHLPLSNPSERAKYVNAGLPDLTELWNIVFIQYMRNIEGSITPLANNHVDTGMGFERLVAVLQGKSSNYDTDLFLPIFNEISKLAKTPPYAGIFEPSDERYTLDHAYRVLADHARMCTICIADGMYPEQNYRLEHVFRKTFNIAEKVFNKPNLLQEAVIPKIVETLGQTYPELEKNYEKILQIVSYEAESYKCLLEKTSKDFHKLKLKKKLIAEEDILDYPGFFPAFQELEKQLKSDQSIKTLTSEHMFQIYKTHGLNAELIEKLAQEKDLNVDINNFSDFLKQQKVQSKQMFSLLENDHRWNDKLNELPKTDDSFKYNYHYNKETKLYDIPEIESKILHLQSDSSGRWYIITNETNFYHTAGGQCSDSGQMLSLNDEKVFNIDSVEVKSGRVIHSGHFSEGTKPFSIDDTVKLIVNSKRRTALTQHHTATHLLQAAIKHLTNKVIYQKSSSVTAENLKFDMGVLGNRLINTEIDDIENLIRKIIASAAEVETIRMTPLELYASDQITTVPGTIYPNQNIRVLQIKSDSNKFLTLEPCCGTHVRNTSELGDFCITSIKSTKSITTIFTAVCGQLAKVYLNNEKEMLPNINEIEDKLSGEVSEIKLRDVHAEVKQIKNRLKNIAIPFLTKIRFSTKIEEIDKRIKLKRRELARKSILLEMKAILKQCDENKQQFIVHILPSTEPLEFILLREVTDLCKNYPVLVLNLSQDRIVGARASIPFKYTTEQFTAKVWLNELEYLKPDIGVNSIKNECSVCDMRHSSIKFENETKLDAAMNRLNEIIKKHILEHKI